MSKALMIYLGGVFGTVWQLCIFLLPVSAVAIILIIKTYKDRGEISRDGELFVKYFKLFFIMFFVSLFGLIFTPSKATWLAMHGVTM